MIGYDFNGVVDTGRFRPTPEDVIITGNTYPPKVLEYLRQQNIDCPVYFQPGGQGRYAAAVWKSEMIRRTGCKVFYEDDTLQAQIIRESCPGVDVEIVG